jgi:chaperonin GroES
MAGDRANSAKEDPRCEAMDFSKKQLLVVGDRVLIAAEDGDERTRVGLYLPATAIDSQQVQTGLIVATGPGDPVADISSLDDEPWKVDRREGKSRGMQARVGDHAIFFRKAAVEISFEEKKYLVVPQAAILVLIRDDLPI